MDDWIAYEGKYPDYNFELKQQEVKLGYPYYLF